MKKKKTLALILAFVLTAVLAAGVGAYAASNYGTSSDPLVTLSYLNEKLTPSLMSSFQSQVNTAVNNLDKTTGGAGPAAFEVLSLSKGQTLTGMVGCELLLRSGSASCSGEIVDSTGGGTLKAGGAVSANHLYMVSQDGGGFTVSSAQATILIRGPYAIG